MPKLPSLKPREVVKKLKKLGFIEHHQVGSHLTMKNPQNDKRAIKGTLAAILRESDIDREEFLRV